MRIGIDLEGSDQPPAVLFEGVLEASQSFPPGCTFIAIATELSVEKIKERFSFQKMPGIEFHVVSDAIVMSDEPVRAVVRKKGSSMVEGVRLLKKKQIDAFVTAGNTGALVASAAIHLPKLPGIKRPALLVEMPTKKGTVAVLDVGGTVFCKEQHLIQSAYMGAAYQGIKQNKTIPVLGLLNVGVESKKGTNAEQQAYSILKKNALDEENQFFRFAGNIEAREIFEGAIDVVVTDGFTGNVLLKTSEGVASFIFEQFQSALKEYPGNLFDSAMKVLNQRFNYAEYPGAILCGVEGVVVKCHGHSSPQAMLNAIKGAKSFVEKDFVAKFKDRLQKRK